MNLFLKYFPLSSHPVTEKSIDSEVFPRKLGKTEKVNSHNILEKLQSMKSGKTVKFLQPYQSKWGLLRNDSG